MGSVLTTLVPQYRGSVEVFRAHESYLVTTADRWAGVESHERVVMTSLTSVVAPTASSIEAPVVQRPSSDQGPRRRLDKVVHESKRWQRPYQRRLLITDLVMVAVAVAVAQLLRFGAVDAGAPIAGSMLSYTSISVALGAVWFAFLGIYRTRDLRILGAGADEYRRLVDATLRLFGLIAIVAFVVQSDVARGYLAVALPLGLLGLALDRWVWRHWLVRQRTRGGYSSTVVVIGSRSAAVSMSTQFERDTRSGFRVVGVCIPGYHPDRGDRRRRGGEAIDVDGHAIPVLGDEHSVLDALARTGADTVAVTATEHLGPEGMRTLAWELQAVDVDLVVAPGVVDVAGPRLKIRPVAGLPLLHVEEPQYEGASRFAKLAFDLLVAGVVLLLSSPLLLFAALAIRLTSRGPVLYKAERVGLNGESFTMYKLRSMTADADTKVIELAGVNEAAGPLFKIRHDPRVTPVGKVLRRFSVDELPQLANVLLGHMSVVGPRPPLRREVDTYTGDVHRRLLVKPGVTGLWQVSGRSDLSWEESVRLDLSYVENWSMVQDLLIVWRTVRAVLRSDGAY